MFSSTNFQSHQALAIETSGRNGSVALSQGNTVLARETFSHGLKHAAGLLPLIDKLMREQGWPPSKLDYLYVSHGPGSFTGLRIGITLAKTLAFTTGAQIVAVPTTRVLAMNAPVKAREVVIVLDAKRDQIFTARYTRAPAVAQVCQQDGPNAEPKVNQAENWIEQEPAHLDSLSSMLARAGRPVYLLGEGIPYHRQFLPPNDDGIHITEEPAWIARAEIVAQIGMEMAQRGEFTAADSFAPLYIRKPEAEEKYDLQHQPNMR